MSYIVTTDISCDSCGDWTFGAVGPAVRKRSATKEAKTKGWIAKDGKHFCPDCAARPEPTGEN